MTDEPIFPTGIFPPGAPLPDRPPGPGDIPPWREPPPPSAVPAPASTVIEVHVTVTPDPDPVEPEPTKWERLTAWVTGIAPLWKIVAVLFAAVCPIPGVGYSAGSIWAYVVGDARASFGIAYGYGLALVPLALAARALTRTRSLRALFTLVVALIGLTGAIAWFDLVTLVTGVRR